MEGDLKEPCTNGILTVYPQLLDISDQKFRQVVQLLDPVQHNNEVREALDYIRLRITRLRPPRPLTPRRLCYLPVEDFLVYDRRTAAEGLITRLAMARAWSFIASKLDTEMSAGLSAELKKIDPRDTAAINTFGAELWPIAAEILTEAIETSLHDKALRQSLLGGEVEIMVDLVQIARGLAAGRGVQAIKMGLPPRPMGELGTDILENIRRVVDERASGNIDKAYAMVLAVAVRMEVPGNLLERLPRILHQFNTEDREAIIDRITAFVLGDMAVRTGKAIHGKEADIAERAYRAGSIIQSLNATERTLRTVAPIMKRELKSIRTAAESVTADIVTEASRIVEAAVKAGPEAALEERMVSEQNLVALRRCSRFAEKVGLDHKVSDALQAVASDMRGRIERILETVSRHLHADNDMPFQNWPQSERTEFVWAVRMLEVSGEIEEAAAIWRRINMPHQRSA